MRIGLDIGSTTLKCVVLDNTGNILHKSYKRHYSQIKEKAVEMLSEIAGLFPHESHFNICIAGSAGMGLADNLSVPFVQEVYAARSAVTKLIPDADVVIELGGEDAKILFLTGGLEVRMNGSCAGGTGAFIDQMATLLNITVDEMNALAMSYSKIYTVASRCGVFAKSDIQPLLNQGAKKNDICASIFNAVVNQTIQGLAQGRDIIGKVVYLGGPLTFLSELRHSFNSTLKTAGICPENSIYYIAIGAAYCSKDYEKMNIGELIKALESYKSAGVYSSSQPLFTCTDQYDDFVNRHKKADVEFCNVYNEGDIAYIGIDAGSTTVKLALINEVGQIMSSSYVPNSGNPVPIVKEFLENVYTSFPGINIKGSAATGYGEEIIKNAFDIDYGIVETVAHFTASKRFMPNVDFIIDIGGQDIKCFKIKNGAIDNIFLNEACSSGCGSFLQTFAGALGYNIEDFAKLGYFGDRPVDLGSRCTVFMNSSVKQAQKDGATIENISAGLSVSVVKNAIYKVIRATTAGSLGDNIVVQGGTFLNDAVLRAFEMEIQKDVVRPRIAGLMGAYGAALYAKEKAAGRPELSSIITKEELESFTHKVTVTTCGLCGNGCKLTVNAFNGGRKYIGGNRCEKPVNKSSGRRDLNIYSYKLDLLAEYTKKPPQTKKYRGKIGLPMALNIFELLPFWHTFFSELGFLVVTSPLSDRSLYLNGQHTIPSDTVCFPAKLVHGHIDALVKEGVTNIFYPCLTYNLDEGISDNHYNCPVVAYYPEVIAANVSEISGINFIYDYIGIHRKQDFVEKIHRILGKYFSGITIKEIKSAVVKAYAEHDFYLGRIRGQCSYIMSQAEKNNLPVIILAGRPYHIDPEISHGIDQLIIECGAAVISEDGLEYPKKKQSVTVLNQWTYHGRLYAAAKYIEGKENMNLVQLVSFGCGVDAITTDEVRSILESSGKIYTQIKIDEITNLGAVKIRLRSLFAATT